MLITRKLLLGLFVIGVILIAGSVGYNLGLDNSKVVEKPVVIQGATKYVELPPEIITETETYYYTELRDFDNEQEFLDW